MPFLRTSWICIALLSAAITTQAEEIQPSTTSAPKEENAQVQILMKGKSLLQLRRHEEAMREFDKVSGYFEEQYRDTKQRIYCASGLVETVAYMTEAAVNKEKNGAIAVNSAWCMAYYLKAYSLIDLQRPGEAKALLNRAIAMAPHDATYQSELGHAYQMEKDWPLAMAAFKAAEDSATNWISPSDEVRKMQLNRALRGQAYVLVEQKKLEEAEAIYRRCLENNPRDIQAQNELKYIARIKAQTGSPAGSQ